MKSINKIFGIYLMLLLIGTLFAACITVAESSVQTILSQDFEEDGWTFNNPPTGWTTNTYFFFNTLYGDSHNGLHHAYSFTNNDSMISPSVTFEADTELTFWYAKESAAPAQSLEVYLDGTTLIFSDYEFTNVDYIQVTTDLSSYTGDHFIEFFNPGPTGTYGYMIDDIIITSVVEETTSDDDPKDPGSPDLPPPDDSNQNPVAKFLVSELVYQINTEIVFNASESSDMDGDILEYVWDFDDSNVAEGMLVTHSFQTENTYTVTLTVSDGNGGSDSFSKEIIINPTGNIPPKEPSVKAESVTLEVDSYYSFLVSSIDDGDQIKYVVDWGDNETVNTDYIEKAESHGFNVNLSHKWTKAGVYIVSVTAIDNQSASSKVTTTAVFVDVNIIEIDDEIVGYILDFNKNNTYTQFFNSDDNSYANVQMVGNKSSEGFASGDTSVYFLIDLDGDKIFDYNYSKSEGLISYGSVDTDEGNEENDKSSDDSSKNTPGFEIIVVFSAFIIFLFFYKKKDEC